MTVEITGSLEPPSRVEKTTHLYILSCETFSAVAIVVSSGSGRKVGVVRGMLVVVVIRG